MVKAVILSVIAWNRIISRFCLAAPVRVTGQAVVALHEPTNNKTKEH